MFFFSLCYEINDQLIIIITNYDKLIDRLDRYVNKGRYIELLV